MPGLTVETELRARQALGRPGRTECADRHACERLRGSLLAQQTGARALAVLERAALAGCACTASAVTRKRAHRAFPTKLAARLVRVRASHAAVTPAVVACVLADWARSYYDRRDQTQQQQRQSRHDPRGRAEALV